MNSATPTGAVGRPAAVGRVTADTRYSMILSECVSTLFPSLREEEGAYLIDRPVVDSIDLYDDIEMDGSPSVVLVVHAGRTPGQARLLIPAIREKAMSILYGDWIFIPEPVLACTNGSLTLDTDLPVTDYIRGWKAFWRESEPVEERAADPASALSGPVRAGLISRMSAGSAISASRDWTGGGGCHVCPGLCLKHIWRGSVAADLEKEGAFAGCVRERARQALDILGQTRH